MSTVDVLNKHFGIKPLYPFQKKCLKREEIFSREEQAYIFELTAYATNVKR